VALTRVAGLPVVLALVAASSALGSSGSQTGAGVLPGEAIYAVASKTAWESVHQVIDELRFRAERRDNKNQIVVTRWQTYDTRILPDLGSFGPAPDRPLRVQLHVSISPRLEPARVAVGVILELAGPNSQRLQQIQYRHAGLEGWLLDRLGERLQSPPVALAASIQAREAQSARLMPAGLSNPCATRTERSGPVARPDKTSDVRPLFPNKPGTGELASEGVVRVEGVVTEHGTFADLKVLNPTPETRPLEASAKGAVGLWRFTPALRSGCPVAVIFTVSVSYTLQ
jgi:TonB family protein